MSHKYSWYSIDCPWLFLLGIEDLEIFGVKITTQFVAIKPDLKTIFEIL